MTCGTCKATDADVVTALTAGLVCESEPYCALGELREFTVEELKNERPCGCDCGGCDDSPIRG